MNAEYGKFGLLGNGASADARAKQAALSKQTMRLAAYVAMGAMDVVMITLGFLIGGILRFTDYFLRGDVGVLAVTIPAFTAFALNMRAYSINTLQNPRRGIQRAMTAFFYAIAITALAGFLFKTSAEFSRVAMILGALAALVLIPIGRLFSDFMLHRVLRWTPWREIVILDGADYTPARDATVIVAGPADIKPDASDPMMLDRLARVLHKADRVIIACPHERRAAWSLILKGTHIHGYIVAPEIGEIGAIGTGRYGGASCLHVACGPLALRDRMKKRAFDVGASVAALFLFAPLLLLTALAIKLDSRGPIFFRQDRLGRNNALFQILKFRSMRVDTLDHAGNRSASRDDDRITRVGRFIRATSIDELPQLLNVLKGDMSFVGPRPHALGSTAGDKLFWEVDERYWHRHSIKPGMTGLAQVRGFRGATERRTDLENRLQADLEYLAGWTIWRDFAILLRTAGVLVHRNAY